MQPPPVILVSFLQLIILLVAIPFAFAYPLGQHHKLLAWYKKTAKAIWKQYWKFIIGFAIGFIACARLISHSSP